MPRRSFAFDRLPRLLCVLAFGLGLALPATAAAAPGSSAPAATANFTTVAEYCADAEEQAVVDQINNYRAQNGLGPLALSQVLGAAAQHHSDDMAARNYFSHTLADGTTFAQNIRIHGYTYETLIGENLAAGNAGAALTFEQWRTSPGHNTNMLRAGFNAVGVARAFRSGTDYGWYWTTTFGGVADGAATLCGSPPPAPNPSPSPAPSPAPSAPPAIAANASTTSDLNLRSGPDLGAAILTVMPFGSRIAITGGAQNNFYPVSYDGTSGFAYADYIAPDGSPAPTPSPSLAPNPVPGGPTAVVTTRLNLRAGPSLGDTVLLVMPFGASVTLTGQSQNGFLSVSYNSTAGWSSADYLATGGNPGGNPGGGATATVTTDLNLRWGPSLADGVILVMPAGAVVTRTGDAMNGFLGVVYNGQFGWAYADYLA